MKAIFLLSLFTVLSISAHAQHDHGPGNTNIKNGNCTVNLKGSRGYKSDRLMSSDNHLAPGWRPYITKSLEKKNEEVSLAQCYELALLYAKVGEGLNDHYYTAKINDKIAIFHKVTFSFKNSDISFDGTIRAEAEKAFSSGLSCKIAGNDTSVNGEGCFKLFIQSTELAKGDVVSFSGVVEQFKIKLK